MEKKVLSAIVLLILFLTSCSQPGVIGDMKSIGDNRSAVEATYIELAKEIAPILHFHKDEKYLLTSFDYFLKNTRLVDRDTGSSNFPAIDYKDSTDPSHTYNLEIQNSSVKNGDLSTAKVYANVKTFGLSRGYVDIQYWFFYAYNGGGHLNTIFGIIPQAIANEYGEHEGDWEHVTVRVSISSKNILAVYFSQHNEGMWVTDMNKIQRTGTQIHIFPSLDGHANCYSAGNHNYHNGWLTNMCGYGKEFNSLNNVEILGVNGILTDDYKNLINIINWGEKGSTYRGGSFTSETEGIGKSVKAVQYDTGKYPSATIVDENRLIEVHRSENNNYFYYNIGTILEDQTIYWSRIGQRYDKGDRPDITSTKSGKLVEVHKSENTNKLYCDIGTLNSDDTITWKGLGSYQTGNDPDIISVSTSAGERLVAVHSGGSDSTKNKLYYNVGIVNSNNTVSWVRTGTYYDTGRYPAMAVHPNGTIIEFHKGSSSDKLYYNVGKLNYSNNSVNWIKRGISYGSNGTYPTVAVKSDGTVVEVHKSENYDDLYYNVGTFNTASNLITWDSTKRNIKYDTGCHADLAVNNSDYLIEVHNDPDDERLFFNSLIQFFF